VRIISFRRSNAIQPDWDFADFDGIAIANMRDGAFEDGLGVSLRRDEIDE